MHRFAREAFFLHELAEISGVDKQQAQNSADFYFILYFILMERQAGETPKAKKMYFLQAPVGSWSCEHFLLSTVETYCLFVCLLHVVVVVVFLFFVFTELKGASCLLSASGFIYCLFIHHVYFCPYFCAVILIF